MKYFLAVAIILAMAFQVQAASNVTFGWDASSGATGYRVYQSLTKGVYSVVSRVCDVTALTCTVPNVLDGTYYFVATAYNSSGESEYSNEIMKTFAPPIPGAPSNLKINLNVNVTVNP